MQGMESDDLIMAEQSWLLRMMMRWVMVVVVMARVPRADPTSHDTPLER